MIYLHTVFYSTEFGKVEHCIPFVDPSDVGPRESVRRMHALTLKLMDELKRIPMLFAFPELVRPLVDAVQSGDERPHGSYEARVIRRFNKRDIVDIRPHRLFAGGIVVYTGQTTGTASLFWLGPKSSKHALTHHEWISYLFGTQISCEDMKEACRIFAR